MGRRRGPLLELTRARWLEFLREPEAIFWVFVFPVLLAGGLGIAFRNRPTESVRVVTTMKSVEYNLAFNERLDTRKKRK